MADDKEIAYWNGVYAAGKYVRGDIPQDASPFAHDVKKRLQTCIASVGDGKNGVVWEWGCGNGRDALFFAHNGLKVVATDLSDVSIARLNAVHKDNKNVVFVASDFTSGNLSPDEIVQSGQNVVVGAIYSRFTIHSVREDNASVAFKWAFSHLSDGGLLVIETRSVKDALCGVGKEVEGERNAWIEDHYRRFTDKDELADELRDIGFEVESVKEGTGLAVYKDEDPCVIRIIARKTVS